MCCGKNREQMSRPEPVQLMSDVAEQRSTAVIADAPAPAAGFSTTLMEQDCVFEYRGRTGVIAIGGVTGKRYYFSETGKRLRIDPRDRSLMAMLDGLVQVKDMDTTR
jgi:hypothetical protein